MHLDAIGASGTITTQQQIGNQANPSQVLIDDIWKQIFFTDDKKLINHQIPLVCKAWFATHRRCDRARDFFYTVVRKINHSCQNYEIVLVEGKLEVKFKPRQVLFGLSRQALQGFLNDHYSASISSLSKVNAASEIFIDFPFFKLESTTLGEYFYQSMISAVKNVVPYINPFLGSSHSLELAPKAVAFPHEPLSNRAVEKRIEHTVFEIISKEELNLNTPRVFIKRLRCYDGEDIAYLNKHGFVTEREINFIKKACEIIMKIGNRELNEFLI